MKIRKHALSPLEKVGRKLVAKFKRFYRSDELSIHEISGLEETLTEFEKLIAQKMRKRRGAK